MSKHQLDRGTLVGSAVAICGVTAGLLLDGGNLRQIVQPTAALIVLGGTAGAVMVQFPMNTLRQAMRQLRDDLLQADAEGREVVEQLVGYCSRARRQGMLALDPELAEIRDGFLRKALTLGVDGYTAQSIREVMEIDLSRHEETQEEIARVFEAAGGFSPTLGIMGAVLGLIQVMQRLGDIAEIGKGIAVAFVSTLYGIGLANLLLLPLAGKLRIRARARQVMREMALEAVTAMVEGVSPLRLRQMLAPYAAEHAAPKTLSPPRQELLAR